MFFLVISFQRFSSIHCWKLSLFINFNKFVCVICLMIIISYALFWRWKIISCNIGFNTNPTTQDPSSICLSEMKQQTCVTWGMSRNLTDIPKVTHFPLVTQFCSAQKCVTSGMPTVFDFKLNFHKYVCLNDKDLFLVLFSQILICFDAMSQ